MVPIGNANVNKNISVGSLFGVVKHAGPTVTSGWYLLASFAPSQDKIMASEGSYKVVLYRDGRDRLRGGGRVCCGWPSSRVWRHKMIDAAEGKKGNICD